MWIECQYGDQTGDIGVRVQRVDNNRRGIVRQVFTPRVPRTNVSGEPKLKGWLGETNNISRTALGVVRVTRLTADGDRVLVRRATPAEVRAWLKEQGLPGLAEAV